MEGSVRLIVKKELLIGSGSSWFVVKCGSLISNVGSLTLFVYSSARVHYHYCLFDILVENASRPLLERDDVQIFSNSSVTLLLPVA